MSCVAEIYAIEAVSFACAICSAYLTDTIGSILWTFENWHDIYQNGAGIGGVRCPGCNRFNRLPNWPTLPGAQPRPTDE